MEGILESFESELVAPSGVSSEPSCVTPPVSGSVSPIFLECECGELETTGGVVSPRATAAVVRS